MKPALILDFDLTIVDTIAAYCETYRHNQFMYHKKIVRPDPDKVEQWNMQDQCPPNRRFNRGITPNEIFDDEYFFRVLRPFPYALEAIKKLSFYYTINICTLGTPLNIVNKIKYIKSIVDGVSNIWTSVQLEQYEVLQGKLMFNMSNCIIVDDHIKNLESCNADYRICFGKEYNWNKDWQGMRIDNWLDLEKLLLNLYFAFYKPLDTE